MKKWFCVFLTAVMLVCALTGCGEVVPGNPTIDPTGDTWPSSPEQTVNIAPTAPAEPMNPVAEYDPDREIFILCGQNSMTFHQKHGYVRGYWFYIFSKEALKESDISVSVQLETAYTLDVRELPLEGIVQDEELSVFALAPGTYKSEQFPYWLYAAYRGMDFQKLYQLREKKISTSNSYQNGTGTLEEAVLADEAYTNYYRQYEADYVALSEDMLPQFHVYQVMINFDINILQGTDFVDECFTAMDITIGNQLYHEEIGEIWLKQTRKLPAELDWYIWDASVDDGVLGYANGPLPFNDGLHKVESYFAFRAEGNMTLTDLILEEPRQELVKVWVKIVTQDGFTSAIDWDLKEPIEIYEGDAVTVDIAYREDTMESMGYNAKVWGCLLYDHDGITYCKLSESHLTRQYNYYEIYAMVFHGLDIESYYRDYYYPAYESWRQ